MGEKEIIPSLNGLITPIFHIVKILLGLKIISSNSIDI